MAQEGVTNEYRTANNHILAVGGGKGGTGKSLFAASLGICLAARGSEVLLVDADLGTANLHTFFGLEPPRVSLSDFVTRKRPRIDCVITKTGMANLKLISIKGSLTNHSQRVTEKNGCSPSETCRYCVL